MNGYRESSWEVRALTEYAPGDLVRVGPQYVGSGRYATSGDEGVYVVLRRISGTADYRLGHVDGRRNEYGMAWALVCHAAGMEGA